MDHTSEYNCHVCNRSFFEFVLFEGHFTFNVKCRAHCGPFMQCYMCDEKFFHFAALNYHLRSHRCSSNQIGRSPLELQRGCRCPVCKANCYSKTQLEKHVRVHEYGKVKCQLCDIRFTTLSLLAHIRQFHEKRNQKSSYRCNMSKAKQFGVHSNGKLLMRHKRLVQLKLKANPIPPAYKIKTKAPLAHVRPDLPQINEDKAIHHCKICKARFNHYPSLWIHLKMHSVGTLNCDICKINARFTKRGLAWHKKLQHGSHHVQTTYKKKTPLAHENQTIHHCKICKAKFSHYPSIEAHLRMHSIGTFNCDICKIKFTKNGLTRHKKLQHGGFNLPTTSKRIRKALSNSGKSKIELHQCNICKATFKQDNNMKKHLVGHAIGTYMCDICNIKFTLNGLTRHKGLFHPELLNHNVFSRITSFQCNICKIFYQSEERLEQHEKCHSGAYKCQVCDISFTKSSLWWHLRKAHPNFQEKNILELLCSVCQMECSTPQHLEEHMKVHSLSELQVEPTLAKNRLPNHEALSHPDLPRERDISNTPEEAPADKVATRKPLVYSHHSTTSERGLHICHICKARFTQHATIAKHLKTHTIGTFNCDICKIKFTQNCLTRHRRLFHPELLNHDVSNGVEQAKRPQQNGKENENENENTQNDDITSYQCKVCKNIYSSEEVLEQHEKCHSGTYKCEVCHISFTKQTLWRHLKQAHPTFKKQNIVKIPCKVCQFECLTPKQLEEHMKVHSESELQCEISSTENNVLSHEALSYPDLSQEWHISNTSEEATADKHPDSTQPSTPSKFSEEPDESIEEAVDEEYKVFSSTQVEDIICHVEMDGQMLYLVRWTGLGPHVDTWEKSSTLDKCPNFLEILTRYTDKITYNCDLELDTEACTFECYICKTAHFTALTDLSSHMNKHIVYQQWVDPLNVVLSNWCPERCREILQNQPLVLVEKLDINSIDFGQRCKKRIVADDKFQLLELVSNEERNRFPIEADSNMEELVPFDRDLVEGECNWKLEISDSEEEELSILEQRTVLHNNGVQENAVDISSQMSQIDNVYVDSNIQISNEEQNQSRTEADSSMEEIVPIDCDLVEGECNPSVELSDSEEEELSTSDQRTVLHNNDVHEDVMDISSQMSQINNATDTYFRISNEERNQSPIEAASNMEVSVPIVSTIDRDLIEGNPSVELPDNEELSVPEQRTVQDVIDISSDSDDEVEIINVERSYCYFCEKIFYSLHELGLHIKMCSTVNS